MSVEVAKAAQTLEEAKEEASMYSPKNVKTEPLADGWLMTFVHDAATERSELLVLDAADPKGPPVASVALPTRIPLGFHGNWVPD